MATKIRCGRIGVDGKLRGQLDPADRMTILRKPNFADTVEVDEFDDD